MFYACVCVVYFLAFLCRCKYMFILSLLAVIVGDINFINDLRSEACLRVVLAFKLLSLPVYRYL